MKQALHIFRKDVRRLWPALVIMFLSQAAFVYSQIGPHSTVGAFVLGASRVEPFASLAMLLSWWYVVVSLVHQEPIPGDRQFWLTRPYSWSSLLAAKALFIILFINFALFIADCVILTSHNFSPLASWQGLIWRQIPFTAIVLMPFLAVASLTRHLGQIILTAGACLLLIILNSIESHTLPGGFSPLSWITSTVAEFWVLATIFTVVVMQYRSRQTWWMRGLLLLAILITSPISIPESWQFRLQNYFKPPSVDTSAIRITFDPSRGHLTDPTPQAKWKTVVLPLTVTGIPAGVEIISGVADVTVDGKSFSEGARLTRKTDGYWATIFVPDELFGPVANRPIEARLIPLITAFKSSDFFLPQQNTPMQVPSAGRCQWAPVTDEFVSVSCQSAFVTPKETYAFAEPPGLPDVIAPGKPTSPAVFGEAIDSPLPAGLCLSPVSNFAESIVMRTSKARVVVRVQRPLAHFQGEIKLSGIKLGDYVLPPRL